MWWASQGKIDNKLNKKKKKVGKQNHKKPEKVVDPQESDEEESM